MSGASSPRGNFADNEPSEGWITQTIPDIAGTAAVYAGENNIVRGGIDAPTITTVVMKEITEAFDDPRTMAQVLGISIRLLSSMSASAL